ncbi:MAG TPA: L,D-transpeptidase family protein [Methyloceanibacter sp.]|nr:L,D-transpeptidase family protein [Methyloceanibacter sp.]
MGRGFLIASLYCLVQAASLGAVGLVRAEVGATTDAQAAAPPPQADAAPEAAGLPEAAVTPETPSAAPQPVEAAPSVPPHPVVAIIREKLADPEIRKGVEADDIAALEAFYGTRSGDPLWITEMGFSARAQSALFEIQKADDWGLEAKAFALPAAGALPDSDEAQALAEIKLDLAILKYARFARGGRHEPAAISELLDQAPPLRDPKEVIAEVGMTRAPDTYLRALHPSHEQFVRLQHALVAARDEEKDGAKASATDIRRIAMNMERWRYMPDELGALYVWLNTPEFMLYVFKDGEPIFRDKTLVGTIGYATPVFSADMKTVVFNPDWVAPPSVLQDKLLPALRRKYFNILTANKLRVSYQGKPVDPTKIDWNRVNIHSFTFSQKSGPKNVLGKAKFLYPNKHIVYMHDTLSYRQKVFKETRRDIGYGCVRMQKPRQFAEVLLAEDQNWEASKVKELWDKGVNRAVSVERKLPVHTTYFTAVVDKDGKVSTFSDLYGIDRKMAVAMFGSADGFPVPPPEPKRSSGAVASSAPARHIGGGTGISSSLGFIGD